MSIFEHQPARVSPSEVAVPGLGGAFETEGLLDHFTNVESVRDSTWAERVTAHMEQHLRGEREVVDGYEELRADTSGTIAYLLDIVISDERRHHRLFAELARSVGSLVSGTESNADAVPAQTHIDEPQRLRLLEATRGFIQVERDDERQLHDLERELRPVRTTTVWPLLIEMMALDTEKHLKILHRIERMLAK
jgi:rubrerythrin